MTMVGRLSFRVAALCLIAFMAWQFASIENGVWGKDLSAHPDEAAHFTTGVMVRDYLRQGATGDPVRFATQFYAHYPKVAIGHWPPFFYLVEAVWLTFYGESIASARLLVLFLALLWIAVAMVWVGRDFGLDGALAACAVLLGLGVVRVTATELLSDSLAALLCLAALLLWLRYFENRRGVDALLFAAAASAAILTKGNAWVLLLAIGFTPALAREWAIYRDKWFWISGLIVVALSAPFYFYVRSMQAGYPTTGIEQALSPAILQHRVLLSLSFLSVLPAIVWVLAVVGSAAGWRLEPGPRRLRWAVAFAFVVSMMLFLTVSGLSFEDRVLLPVLPFLLLLACGGGFFVASLRDGVFAPVALALLLLCFVPIPTIKLSIRDGYRNFQADLPRSSVSRAMLVASDSIGEGAMLAAQLTADPMRRNAVIRGSKFLSEQDWNGNQYRELFDSDGMLAAAIDSIPVRYVLIDDWSNRPHVTRLKRIARQRFLLMSQRQVAGKTVSLYENPEAIGRPIEALQFNLGRYHGNRLIQIDSR